MELRMEISQISQLAAVLHANPKSDATVFSISSKLLQVLNVQFEQHIEVSEGLSTSFKTITPVSILTNDFFQDLQYIYNYIKHSKTLKLFNDDDETEAASIDISRFKSIKLLELYKVDVNSIKGLQKLRSQLQTLICSRSTSTLSDLLIKCGDDRTATFSWTELKEVSFTNNGLQDLDSSFESIPWVHHIDLSRNELTTVENLNLLHTLKILNLSYNKLEAVPQFKGSSCNHLQNFAIKNNFVENIMGLQSLRNLSVLDLSNNCLIDHKCLVSISHIATLQWLNLTGNPLCFHPHHRNLTASYLHNNIKNVPFVLDGIPLEKTHRKFIGTLHPMQLKNSSSFATDSISLSSEKSRKVRHVVIEDESSPKTILEPFTIPQHHLDTKRQIEDLREQYGESWLNSSSGLAVQNVLGLGGSSRSTPCETYLSSFGIDSLGSSPQQQGLQDFSLDKNVEEQTNGEELDDTKASFKTAYDNSVQETVSSDSSDDDIDLGGEENIYLVTPKGAEDQIFLVITNTHLSEQECSTSKERVRWHINSVIKCERLEDNRTVVLDFDTMRKDKKQRIYEMEQDEIDKFVTGILERISSRVVEKGHNNYQCIKCSTKFNVKDKNSINPTSFSCPKCDSNLVVEDL